MSRGALPGDLVITLEKLWQLDKSIPRIGVRTSITSLSMDATSSRSPVQRREAWSICVSDGRGEFLIPNGALLTWVWITSYATDITSSLSFCRDAAIVDADDALQSMHAALHPT